MTFRFHFAMLNLTSLFLFISSSSRISGGANSFLFLSLSGFGIWFILLLHSWKRFPSWPHCTLLFEAVFVILFLVTPAWWFLAPHTPWIPGKKDNDECRSQCSSLALSWRFLLLLACFAWLLNSYFGIVKESLGGSVSSMASVDSDTRQLMPLQKRCCEILFFVMFVKDAI